MALISCNNVSLKYESATVVSDLTFTVSDGDYLCIVGENGSGKSTLIKALLGLKAVSGGTVDYSDGLRRSEIGYLPQQSGIQRDFPASAEEVVLSGCMGHKGLCAFYTKEDKRRAAENMERLSVSDLRKKSYRELSGGQQQRLLLARALCATKKLLLLDEPVTGLDPLVTAELYELLRKINTEMGIALVMVSHDIRCAAENSRTILHLDKKPLFIGTTEDYIHSEIGRKFIGECHKCYNGEAE